MRRFVTFRLVPTLWYKLATKTKINDTITLLTGFHFDARFIAFDGEDMDEVSDAISTSKERGYILPEDNSTFAHLLEALVAWNPDF